MVKRRGYCSVFGEPPWGCRGRSHPAGGLVFPQKQNPLFFRGWGKGRGRVLPRLSSYSGGDGMKRLLIQLPEELHQDLHELARRHKASMSELIRRAIDAVYEDELDGLMMDREVESYKADPSSAVDYHELKAKNLGAVPG
ncbi:MAG: ribbon-helix-helix protein, CopG family [Dehalococcoidia bacterium]|nr:ribbon-helix-helix protein, CopG family [Dehalococcoidia bacterium]